MGGNGGCPGRRGDKTGLLKSRVGGGLALGLWGLLANLSRRGKRETRRAWPTQQFFARCFFVLSVEGSLQCFGSGCRVPVRCRVQVAVKPMEKVEQGGSSQVKSSPKSRKLAAARTRPRRPIPSFPPPPRHAPRGEVWKCGSVAGIEPRHISSTAFATTVAGQSQKAENCGRNGREPQAPGAKTGGLSNPTGSTLVAALFSQLLAPEAGSSATSSVLRQT